MHVKQHILSGDQILKSKNVNEKSIEFILVKQFQMFLSFHDICN